MHAPSHNTPESPVAARRWSLDVTQGRKVGWETPSILVLFVTAAVAAIVFVVVELRSHHL